MRRLLRDALAAGNNATGTCDVGCASAHPERRTCPLHVARPPSPSGGADGDPLGQPPAGTTAASGRHRSNNRSLRRHPTTTSLVLCGERDGNAEERAGSSVSPPPAGGLGARPSPPAAAPGPSAWRPAGFRGWGIASPGGVGPGPSHAAALLGRELVDGVVAVVGVQEGDVVVVGQRPAAGSSPDFFLLDLPPAPHAFQREVVAPDGRLAGAAAVAEKHRLIRLVAQAQLADAHLQLLQGAGFVASAGALPPAARPGEERQLVAPRVHGLAVTLHQRRNQLPDLPLRVALQQAAVCKRRGGR